MASQFDDPGCLELLSHLTCTLFGDAKSPTQVLDGDGKVGLVLAL
jgi:hypothetical protein